MKDMKNLITDASIVLALLAALAALVVIVISQGPEALGPTGLHDLVILLGGALAGVSTVSKG